jgi:hypothetical protein
VQDSSQDTSSEEVVLLQLPARRVRYLLQVVQEACQDCATGTRTVSVWVTARGTAEAVAWCAHCFNATCKRVPFPEGQEERLEWIRVAVQEGRVSRPWRAARPAVEDLERRGLL